MTYEEVLVCYNTEARRDHCTRNADCTPFTIMQNVEGYHQWYLERVIGVRYTAAKGLEVTGVYRGFDKPEWVTLSRDYWNTLPFTRFEQAHKAEVARVVAGQQRFFCLPECNPEGETETHEDLIRAQEWFDEQQSRYEEERDKGWIVRTKQRSRNDKLARNQPHDYGGLARGDEEEEMDADDADAELIGNAPYVDSAACEEQGDNEKENTNIDHDSK
mmetsp:Transcript_2674/g.9410  ORF Transcript_2674/g.9410 Transcript_2674/m.9410 type:complete len:217 (-) Transcript_2674:24-674(-)